MVFRPGKLCPDRKKYGMEGSLSMGMKKKLAVVLCAGLVLAPLTSCGKQEEQNPQKVEVTMVYSEKLDNVEALIEDRLPDVDFQYERMISSTFNSSLQRRLDAGHGPDLVVSTQPADQDSGKYVLPLGGYSFTAAYESTLINSLSVDDMVYYLPFPGQYYGYIVNKTLFDEEGISLPKTNEEMVEALCRFRDKGIGVSKTGHVFGFRDHIDTSLGNFLAGCMVPDFLGTAAGVSWLSAFEEKQAEMTGTWESAFGLLDALVEKDLINTAPYSKQGNSPDNRTYMSQGNLVVMYGYTRTLEECREMNRQWAADGGQEYEYTMLTFMGKEDVPNWTISMPGAYLGINAALGEEGNEAKLDACRRILELLSTREGQEALMADTMTDNSYLKGFDHNTELPLGLEEAVKAGYVYNVKFPGKVIEYLGRESALYLGGKLDLPECLAAVDDYYLNGSAAVDEELEAVGSVARDLIYEGYDTRIRETALGNLVADSVAALSGAPIAVVNGGGIRASLYEGEVRNLDLNAVCPFDNQIVKVEMSGRVLLEMLENSLSQYKSSEEVPGGRFLQVSGICYTFDSANAPEARLISAALSDGTPIDETAAYTVAVNNYMAGKNGYLEGNGDGFTMLNLYSDEIPKAEQVRLLAGDMGTYRDALRYYFRQHEGESVSAAIEGRITNLSESGERKE